MKEQTIVIYPANNPPHNERNVCGFDSWINQWRLAVYLPQTERWMDDEGLDFRPEQITQWFDFPNGDDTIVYKTLA